MWFFDTPGTSGGASIGERIFLSPNSHCGWYYSDIICLIIYFRHECSCDFQPTSSLNLIQMKIFSSHVFIMVGYPKKSYQNTFTNCAWKSILILGYTSTYLIFTLFLLKQVIAIVGTYIPSEHHLLPWIYESRPLYGYGYAECAIRSTFNRCQRGSLTSALLLPVQ